LSQHHRLISELVAEGLISGLRIDHIDGLYDPTQYLERLREMAGPDTYTVVEKILEPGEQLPRHWPIEGTTGYEFLALVNNLLTYKNSEEAFTQYYSGLVTDHRSVPQQVRDKKAHILYRHMGGELDNLYRLLMDSGLVQQEDYAQMRTEDIKTAIAAFLIHCPVYRFYGRQLPLEVDETKAVQLVFEQARATRPDLSPAFALLEKIWLQKPLEGDADYTAKALHFYQRCMQFTGPLMAKGVEDTLMYTFHRFIGHNEVGDAPEAFGMSVKEFHKAMKQRQKLWPLSLNATATHDTKRGEDVRARLNVLTDRPAEWLAEVEAWSKMNAPLRKNGAPDANDEYFIYQTLVGSLPFEGTPEDNYTERLQEYLQKALREAKSHSGWDQPNEDYEQAAKDFARALLDPAQPFRKRLLAFQRKIADFAIVNSLVQVLLKFTCPGIPDVYQGCELWDLSLVDPDNRRPVDYIQREQLLHAFEGRPQPELLAELWQTRTDARLKLWLTRQLYQLRKAFPEAFTRGRYIPLKIEGRYQNHVIAFAREYKRQWFLVAAPLHLGSRKQASGDLLTWDWEDTAVVLPDQLLPEWEHLLTGQSDKHEGRIPVQHLFSTLPLAVLKGRQKENERGAGILLHITSLPSPFGIGDLGPEAYAFADFLSDNHQKYWQLLPLNPTEEGQGHSPYSSTSSRAGNPLLISPELLVKSGLLTAQDLEAACLPQEGKTNFSEAERVKNAMLDRAWTRFQQGNYPQQVKAFAAYKERERSWLPDFACFMVLKHRHGGKPWYEWDDTYRLRDPKALEKLLLQDQQEAIEKIQWIQFVFEEQWASLKNYCNQRAIQLIGDLPFYVSYDSADVWANRALFSLDEKGQRLGLAGVPPDAFSADGQLWGMPVYNWDVMKEQDYRWWIDRLRRNRELFDLVRLDHFRAFADYWEVPAGEETAKKGQWKPGPGVPFFEAMQQALGELPFVAEDLGEINQAVFDLRDQFRLPGMKVLQFAFDENLAQSEYIPHNYTPNFLVYTGTHDNNTIRGWYREDIDDDTRLRLQQYNGQSLMEDDIPGVMARMAYASVARIAILPLQDLLGLDQIARMNIPASGQDNWAWRLLPHQVTQAAARQLREWTELYNRE
ncbi:MAG TPA: malto-oligosyltrehalose synthase, partial [Flavisolibacter sp.]|nr:malto-oligosyltrehalose synthase [Flavisolibacter sp.]